MNRGNRVWRAGRWWMTIASFMLLVLVGGVARAQTDPAPATDGGTDAKAEPVHVDVVKLEAAMGGQAERRHDLIESRGRDLRAPVPVRDLDPGLVRR